MEQFLWISQAPELVAPFFNIHSQTHWGFAPLQPPNANANAGEEGKKGYRSERAGARRDSLAAPVPGRIPTRRTVTLGVKDRSGVNRKATFGAYTGGGAEIIITVGAAVEAQSTMRLPASAKPVNRNKRSYSQEKLGWRDQARETRRRRRR